MSLWQRPNGPQTIAASASNQAGLNAQAAQQALMPATLSLISSTETVVPHPQNSAIPFSLPLVGNEENEQVPFDLVISGFITTTNTTNVTLKLYSGTSLTVGSDTLLGTSGAIAQNTSSAPFEIHAHFVYDSVSGKLTGWIEGILNNSLIARVAISTVITGIKDSNSPVATFVVSATSSAAAGGNATTVTIKNFSVG